MLQAGAAFCGARLASAQDQPTFSTEVKVVNVLATVRNKTGTLVGNLEKDDFSLSEDARPQTIRYFQHESNLPLILGLMVDTSGSQVKVLDQERAASLRFLDRVFRENIDHAFIMQFDTSEQMRQPLTGPSKSWTTPWPTSTARLCANSACRAAAARCSMTRWRAPRPRS
jgi:hypothetical protein